MQIIYRGANPGFFGRLCNVGPVNTHGSIVITEAMSGAVVQSIYNQDTFNRLLADGTYEPYVCPGLSCNKVCCHNHVGSQI
jgi:hypothetical protein